MLHDGGRETGDGGKETEDRRRLFDCVPSTFLRASALRFESICDLQLTIYFYKM